MTQEYEPHKDGRRPIKLHTVMRIGWIVSLMTFLTLLLAEDEGVSPVAIWLVFAVSVAFSITLGLLGFEKKRRRNADRGKAD